MKKFYIETLGCKVNQFESDGIAIGLEKKGWQKGNKSETADLFIINTCAVTSKAGMQSRQAIRKIIRENPYAKVVVTGCHAQTAPEQIKKIEDVDQIICHKDKIKIADQISDICGSPSPLPFSAVSHEPGGAFNGFKHTVSGKMTRAYLKVQDGCTAFCTYCIVPYARGASVSMPQEEVLRQLQQLNRKGFKEVILTGIHTGLYGLDLTPGSSLLELLEKIDRLRPVHRVRLSSIEPGEINDGIIKLAGKDGILCDHFHIPLQSGDDDILKKMKRPYDSALFQDVILRIHENLPMAAIGLDTLIGFPGESEKQFENTYRLVESLPISYLHVFPFSPREGTPAWHFKPKVESIVIKERCAAMRELGKKKQTAFIRKNLGKTAEGLVQHSLDPETGRAKAVTSNYLTIHLEGRHLERGSILNIIPEQCDASLKISGKILK